MWRKRDTAQNDSPFWNGCVIREEEYDDLCRLTVEKCEDGHLTVVCTVYGLMIHGIACEEAEFERVYESLKKELSVVFKREGNVLDHEEELSELLNRYATAKVYKRKILGECK